MTHEIDAGFAETFDCGDGVPMLSIMPRERPVQDEGNVNDLGPLIPARVAAVAVTIVGQLGIGATILLGGNPVIGGVAAIMMMICGMALVLAGVADGRK